MERPPWYSPNSGTKGRVALEGSAGGVGAGALERGGGSGEDRVTLAALSVMGTSSFTGMLWGRGASTALCQPLPHFPTLIHLQGGHREPPKGTKPQQTQTHKAIPKTPC